MDGQTEPGAPGDRQALLSALVTEHFVLQSAAGATISESSSRASIYLASLSSGLVAIGFASGSPGMLTALASTIIPTIFVLGCFTIVRLIDTSIASIVALARIERIRRYYAGLHPDAAEFFPLDIAASTGTLGVRYGRQAFLFTIASMISVVNSVVGGAGTAVILSLVGGIPTPTALVIGIAIGVTLLALLLAYETRRFAPYRERVRESTPGPANT